MMIVTMIYAWHFASAFILFLLLGVVVNLRVKVMSRANVYKSLDVEGDAVSSTNRTRDVPNLRLFDDSEEDVL